jgi:putrescine aminotransferase
LANLQLIEDLQLVERVRDETGPYLAKQYAALADHPLVGEAETCGLMAAIRLVKTKASGTQAAVPFGPEVSAGMVCRGHCFANGLIMRAVGDRMIIAPPLVLTCEQIDEMMVLIRRCLDLTWTDLKGE